MKKIILFLFLMSFCFADYANKDNWPKYGEWKKLDNKEKKKKKIGKIFLFFFGCTVHTFIIGSSIKYLKEH